MQTKQAANIAKVGLIILWLVFMYTITSCKASHPRKCYRTKLKRCTLVANDTIPDYFYINNQIVMIEKTNK